MEDSGIDSEDKPETHIYEESLLKSAGFGAVANQHMSDADFEVAFRGAHLRSNEVYAPTTQELDEETSNERHTEPPNTCRILQRKLELKVERAKRNYTQFQEEQFKATKLQTSTLIPINRLPIPGEIEQKPLVDYQTQSSDEAEEISFFPAKLKHAKRQNKHELTDTFSIQEMTIDSDLDSDDSAGTQNLELLLPTSLKRNFMDKMKRCFGCFRSS